MLLLILKSSACLAIFMFFYKLCLEKTSAHTFKRFYLIVVLLISIGIPFITFTEYIEVLPQTLDTSSAQGYQVPENFEIIEPIKSFQDYVPTILWNFYGLGSLLFAFRFFRNLIQLFQKIRLNPKHKSQNFINVLLQDLITPHTFFNFIFLNKREFENNKIPTEVLLHEQTHAKQKHALDVLFIEILQIFFWFNPLLYFVKKDIKLNHEFLADQAVLKHGINTTDYQQLLLAFSSNASHSSLANAINYSLIKKRFTVMKTQTSKTAVWLRSFIILPLLAILIYGFSEKIVVEEKIDFLTSRIKIVNNKLNFSPKKTTQNQQNKIDKKSFFIIKIIDSKTIFINDKKCDLGSIEDHIIQLIKEKSLNQKEKLVPYIAYNHSDGNNTFATVKNILRKHNFWFVNTFKTTPQFPKLPETHLLESLSTHILKWEDSLNSSIAANKKHKIKESEKSNTKRKNQIKESLRLYLIEKRERFKDSLKSVKGNNEKHKIKEIKIQIDRDKNLKLNNKKILFKNLKEEVDKINPDLNQEQKQKYLGARIIYSESISKFSEEIKDYLTKNCHITHWYMSNISNPKKSNYQLYSNNPYRGKTINESDKILDSIHTLFLKSHPKAKNIKSNFSSTAKYVN